MSSQLLKVAVIGTGSSLSVFHHPIIKILSDHYVLHSVVERSGKETCRESVGPSVKIVRTLDEVVDDPDVDLVVVSTPNKTHYEYCTKALEKGKHGETPSGARIHIRPPAFQMYSSVISWSIY